MADSKSAIIPGAMRDLSVVIVSYNVRPLLARCLAALAADLARTPTLTAEVFVVDNASTDGSAALVRQDFPWVHLIVNPRNVGFARANNQALTLARGRYALLLNPDTEVTPGALARLVAFADAHPRAAVVGPQLRYPDGRPQSSRRRFPTLLTAFVESTPLQQWFPQCRLLRHYYAADLPDDQPAAVDWVVGAAMLVRRAAIDAVGLLDEGYFMYAEELDWCRRLKAAGWEVYYAPEAVVIHHEGQSSQQNLARRHILFTESKCRYVTTYHGRLAGTVLRLFLTATVLWQAAEEAAKLALRHRPDLRRERLRIYRQVLAWEVRRWLGRASLENL